MISVTKRAGPTAGRSGQELLRCFAQKRRHARLGATCPLHFWDIAMRGRVLQNDTKRTPKPMFSMTCQSSRRSTVFFWERTYTKTAKRKSASKTDVYALGAWCGGSMHVRSILNYLGMLSTVDLKWCVKAAEAPAQRQELQKHTACGSPMWTRT